LVTLIAAIVFGKVLAHWLGDFVGVLGGIATTAAAAVGALEVAYRRREEESRIGLAELEKKAADCQAELAEAAAD
jgi:hypothetical protein